MADHLTEVTTTSWSTRLANSFKAILLGLLCFLGAFALLWWNEERSVDRTRTLEAGLEMVIPVSADAPAPFNEGKLIHLSGTATTRDILKDPLFGVQETALKLNRHVEMYQWKEETHTKTETNTGGSETTTTTYSYHKEWSSKPLDSTRFKQPEGHQNPASMPYQNKEFTASTITLGGYTLTQPFIEDIGGYTDYPLTQTHLDAMDPRTRKLFDLHGTEFFHGDPAAPQIGAMRVTYHIITPTDLSIVAKQTGNRLEPYLTKTGDIALLKMGTHSAQTMFQSAQDENTLITWLIRIGGFLLMWIGLATLLGPLKILADVLPILGVILGAGIGILTGLLAIVLSTLTIALAWLFFRPLIGISLLIVSVAIFAAVIGLIKKRASTQPAGNQNLQL